LVPSQDSYKRLTYSGLNHTFKFILPPTSGDTRRGVEMKERILYVKCNYDLNEEGFSEEQAKVISFLGKMVI
jgi:hypothetical protein